jgi:hypothetical protein
VDANFNLEVENKLTNNSVMRQLRSDRAFCNNKVERPIQFACDGMLLDSRVSIINDPVGFLKLCVDNKNVNAYNEVNKTGNSESALNTSDAQLKNPPNLDNLSDANKASIQQTILAAALPTGTCETDTYKTVKDLLNETTQSDTTNSRNTNTSSPKVYESRPNLASAMKDHHLRTLCSVSGTTTDIVAALCGMGNETRVKNALQSLSDAVTQNNNSDSNNNNNANTPIPLNAISIPNMLTVDPTKLTPEFKNLFLSIAMYMQSGQYHSAASVLCGLYCAAMSLGAVVETVVHIASYSALLEAFATSPAAFFPPVAV